MEPDGDGFVLVHGIGVSTAYTGVMDWYEGGGGVKAHDLYGEDRYGYAEPSIPLRMTYEDAYSYQG